MFMLFTDLADGVHQLVLVELYVHPRLLYGHPAGLPRRLPLPAAARGPRGGGVRREGTVGVNGTRPVAPRFRSLRARSSPAVGGETPGLLQEVPLARLQAPGGGQLTPLMFRGQAILGEFPQGRHRRFYHRLVGGVESGGGGGGESGRLWSGQVPRCSRGCGSTWGNVGNYVCGTFSWGRRLHVHVDCGVSGNTVEMFLSKSESLT